MSSAVATAARMRKIKWLWFLLPFPVIFLFLLPIFMVPFIGSSSSGGGDDTGAFPEQVLKWKPLVEQIAAEQGLSQYVPLFLAIIDQETGTSGDLDLMQSSESLGLPPDSLQDPEKSVEAGIALFKRLLTRGQALGDDLVSIIQAYNFGPAYLDFVAAHGHKNTVALAEEFSAEEAAKMGWSSYGNPEYAEQVLAKLAAEEGSGDTGAESALPKGKYDQLMQVALQFQGWPYVYGGSNPATSFDCSGLTQYVYGQIGISLPRTAQEQWDATTHIPPDQARPGDLVFFSGTYNDPGNIVTHVGIYVGNNTMYAANSSGIGYASLDDPFWQEHLYGFGRVRS
ncbi:bifunctional lytic transglycosylase/C40 family peptidase [Alicyclobacillus kakegawensis]|uniref:bifunctional lytic transglycosylase/C40 family peptidase n=1 Tax=Alicyclobacillus kakegawensis TaxID=392012 RepID=UPI00083346E9|nr:bifunctional lytic transglycosylase/C40 family peptidase [Alicyclobacillus kakegawensis]